MICVKKIIPFRKDLEFNTPLYEVTSISLEHHLTKKTDTLISGNFIISGDYKQTESSENKDPFNFTLPFDIALATKIDLDDMLLDVDDFYYETGKNTLKVNIDLLLDATEIGEPEKEKEDRENINEKDVESIDSNTYNDNDDYRVPDEFNDVNYKKPQLENLPNSLDNSGVSLDDIQNDNFMEFETLCNKYGLNDACKSDLFFALRLGTLNKEFIKQMLTENCNILLPVMIDNLYKDFMNLMNNTRMWSLNGFTPMELGNGVNV